MLIKSKNVIRVSNVNVILLLFKRQKSKFGGSEGAKAIISCVLALYLFI